MFSLLPLQKHLNLAEIAFVIDFSKLYCVHIGTRCGVAEESVHAVDLSAMSFKLPILSFFTY